MCPAVVSLLTLRAAFPSDEEYLTFCEGSLGNALASLACAVGQDLHWKSLNHKVLLACRDTRQSVRQAATATLHKLFNEVSNFFVNTTDMIIFIIFITKIIFPFIIYC